MSWLWLAYGVCHLDTAVCNLPAIFVSFVSQPDSREELPPPHDLDIAVAVPTCTVNGGFVVVTLKRPAKGVTQDGTQVDTQDDTQGGNLDKWIENQIRQNPRITTEELARKSNKGIATIKRHLAKMPHIRYVGSGYSGHWEVLDKK